MVDRAHRVRHRPHPRIAADRMVVGHRPRRGDTVRRNRSGAHAAAGVEAGARPVRLPRIGAAVAYPVAGRHRPAPHVVDVLDQQAITVRRRCRHRGPQPAALMDGRIVLRGARHVHGSVGAAAGRGVVLVVGGRAGRKRPAGPAAIATRRGTRSRSPSPCSAGCSPNRGSASSYQARSCGCTAARPQSCCSTTTPRDRSTRSRCHLS